MKIALYGNVCNNMYSIAKSLRNFSDHDVHLYLPENTDFHNLPENDDPHLKNNYPYWIHRSKTYNLGSVLRFWCNHIVNELNKYELIILSSLAVSLAPLLKKNKVLFYVTGGDLTVLPFKEIHQTLLYDGRKNNFKPLVYQYIQRLGIKSSFKIISQPFYPFELAIKKLKIPKAKILEAYFPIIIDSEKVQYRKDAGYHLHASVRADLDRFSFKIFSPSRIITSDHIHLTETGQSKKNDILIRAFAHFIQSNNIKDAGLFLIDRKYTREKEIFGLKNLIKRLGIEDFVVWLKTENNKGFTRDELINIYSYIDLVCDDFGAGWFGSICVEGFCCSKPVLSFVDEVAMRKIYPWHPFLSSNTVSGNSFLMTKVYFDKSFSKAQGDLGRKWALEFHSLENAGRIYLREFDKLLNIY